MTESEGARCLLDEVSEMDVRLQSKLLRAIQERVIDRVGGTRPVPVDIRIIATSNRNLADAVKAGTFREDLLFRLNVVNLKIPALRDRPADILELAQHFAKKYADANGCLLYTSRTGAALRQKVCRRQRCSAAANLDGSPARAHHQPLARQRPRA